LRAGSHSRAEIERLKLNAQPSFDLFYQQGVGGSSARPKAEHFRDYDSSALTPGPTVLSVDTAVKAGPRNSFTVMQAWAPRPDGFYLVDQVREQCGFAEGQRLLRSLIRRLRPDVVLIEDRATGTALIEVLRRRTSIPVVAVNPGQHSKGERLSRHVALIRRKPIFLPEGFPGRSLFVDELLGRGSFTDQSYGLTQMLDFVTTTEIPRKSQQPGLMASSLSIRRAAAHSNVQRPFRHAGVAIRLGSRRGRRGKERQFSFVGPPPSVPNSSLSVG
jgi:phage terminase large subunit-like protein